MIKNHKTTILTCILLFIVVTGIFLFSSQVGSVSHDRSNMISTRIATYWNQYFELNLSGENQAMLGICLYPLIRKIAHLFEYTILGISIYMFFSAMEYDRNQIWVELPQLPKVRLTCVGVIICAVGDEIHQLFIPDRNGCIRDVIWDFFGAIIGLAIIFLVKNIFCKLRELHLKKLRELHLKKDDRKR